MTPVKWQALSAYFEQKRGEGMSYHTIQAWMAQGMPHHRPSPHRLSPGQSLSHTSKAEDWGVNASTRLFVSLGIVYLCVPGLFRIPQTTSLLIVRKNIC